MNKETAKILIQKFQEGILSDHENELLEKYLENDWIQLEELEDLNAMHQNLKLEETEVPSKDLRKDFYKNLELEKQGITSSNTSASNWWNNIFSQNFAKVNWGFGLATLLIGLLLGNLFQTNSNDKIDVLAQQLQETQETMMLALLGKESSRDRLKAVKITHQMDDVSNAVIEAMLTTLNNDDNVNVRLAAVEGLSQYVNNPIVREGLIKAIKNQSAPMVQLALAELMVELQDKKSVNEFQDLMNQEEMPSEIKAEIKKKIKVLL